MTRGRVLALVMIALAGAGIAGFGAGIGSYAISTIGGVIFGFPGSFGIGWVARKAHTLRNFQKSTGRMFSGGR